jgi:hypothetical protein
MRSSTQPYADNGVILSKSSLNVGEEVLLSYTGLLAQSGADQIFVHIGYGENWQEKAFVPMENDNGVFKAAVKAILPGVLNFSFKDSANNWDNNSSNDYSIKVSEKAKRSTKASEVKSKKTEEDTAAVEAKKGDTEKKTSTRKSTAKTAAAKKSTEGDAEPKKSTAKKTASTKKKQ